MKGKPLFPGLFHYLPSTLPLPFHQSIRFKTEEGKKPLSQQIAHHSTHSLGFVRGLLFPFLAGDSLPGLANRASIFFSISTVTVCGDKTLNGIPLPVPPLFFYSLYRTMTSPVLQTLVFMLPRAQMSCTHTCTHTCTQV